MGLEIERKYLLKDDSWRSQVTRACEITQAYFCPNPEYTLRIRIIDQKKALITLKGRSHHLTRKEFEYEIPLDDAQDLIQSFCDTRILHKRRHYILQDTNTWEIDEYFGRLKGFYTAEIELQHEDAFFPKPAWLGREISNEHKYSNQRLASGSDISIP
ncbi:MAG: CYTH domain-containing protein [Lentisphaeria bacterium]